MNNNVTVKILGCILIVFGSLGIAGLLFFYSAVLFSDKWPSLQPAYDMFKLVFTLPTGLVVIYATFIAICIPLLAILIFGVQLFLGKKIVTKSIVLLLCVLWALAMVFGSVTIVHQVQEILTRISPFSPDPVDFDVATQIPLDVGYAFKTTLKNEVIHTQGMPIEGFEPFMFMEAFPGLTETDFEGVEASIGHYTVEEGRLVHKSDDTKLIHSAAKAITDRGLDRLLANVSVRLKVDLTKDGTLTEIMEALVRFSQNPRAQTLPGAITGEGVKDDTPVACTMDAKICPDGSAVGRQGPHCEFAPCPVVVNPSAHVCTPEEKKAQACTMEYAPVCGLVAVQCIKAPCPPVPQTFGNACGACSQSLVVSYTQGACSL